jgi:diguanylate cyclase (GGDEF)-like protein
VISRFGGDEFVILLRRTKPGEIHAINQRIIEALERPVSIAKESVTVGVTTGVAQAIDETEPERLINRADQAMYARKARSR